MLACRGGVWWYPRVWYPCARVRVCVWARARTCVGVGLYVSVSVSVSVVGSCFVDCCMVQLLYMQPCEYVVAAWTLWRGGFL